MMGVNNAPSDGAPLLEGALWPALREYWHVVAWSKDIRDNEIFPYTLLDEEIVVCRLGTELVAFSDLCVHRGTPISLGTIESDQIVCCYHGWEYDATGKCTRIPSIPDEHPIPKRACLVKYPVQERYGMIWVCLSETPRQSLPKCPLAEEPSYRLVVQNKWIWKTGAARATENFFDQAHFVFVHSGLLGDKSKPQVSEPRIERDGDVLHFSVDVPADSTHAEPYVRNYTVFRPFTIYQQKQVPGDRNEVYLNYSSPNSDKHTTRFLQVWRNYDLPDGAVTGIEDVNELVVEQDRIIVERQRPEELPLDLSEELHVKAPDAIAVAYRRFMGELGVEC